MGTATRKDFAALARAGVPADAAQVQGEAQGAAGVEPVVAGRHERHRLGLHLAGAAVGQVLGRSDPVEVVHPAVGELVDRRLDRLRLAHAGADGDPALGAGEEAVDDLGHLLEAGRHRGGRLDGAHHPLVARDRAVEQLGDLREGLALGLADVECAHEPEAGQALDDGPVAVLVLDLAVAHRRKDPDAALALADLAAELALPVGVAGDGCSVRHLHRDEQRVVGGVSVEPRHHLEVALPLAALEHLAHPFVGPLHRLVELRLALLLRLESFAHDDLLGLSAAPSAALRCGPWRGFPPRAQGSEAGNP